MKNEGKTFLQDDAYMYSDKMGEPEYMFLLIIFAGICIIAFIMSR